MKTIPVALALLVLGAPETDAALDCSWLKNGRKIEGTRSFR